MADAIWLQIGLVPQSETARSQLDETVSVVEDVDAHLVGGQVTRNKTEVISVGELVSVVPVPPPPPPPPNEFVPAPTVGSPFTPSGLRPSAYQLLGLASMRTGYHARTVTHLNSTPANQKVTYKEVTRTRASHTDYETIDMRGMKLFWHANNQTPINICAGSNNLPANNQCPRAPAVVGSYVVSETDFTPKSQVGRLLGLDHTQPVAGTDAQVVGGVTQMTPVPQWDKTSDNTWTTWKHADADGIVGAWAHPGRPSVNAYWGNSSGGGVGASTDFTTVDLTWVIVDGLWCRDLMDGFSSYGSSIEMRNTFVQRNHDDIHWCGNDSNAAGPQHVTAVVYGYKNLYWRFYQGVSYLEADYTPPHGGEYTVYDACILAQTHGTGSLPYRTNLNDAQAVYDGYAHANVMKYRSSGVDGVNCHPKLKFIGGTVCLMMGRAQESGLSGINVPVGSIASNDAHFIYIDMAHNTGDEPPLLPPNSASFTPNKGAQSIKDTFGASNYHVISGADINGGVCKYHPGEHPMTEIFWPAVQRWINEHPQFFCESTYNVPTLSLSRTSSWGTNTAILDGAN